jgi:hypothetical protein
MPAWFRKNYYGVHAELKTGMTFEVIPAAGGIVYA